jgi:hypothetical protein
MSMAILLKLAQEKPQMLRNAESAVSWFNLA